MKVHFKIAAVLLGWTLCSCGTEVGNGLVGKPSKSSKGAATPTSESGPDAEEDSAGDNEIPQLESFDYILVNICASPAVAGALGNFKSSDNQYEFIISESQEILSYNINGQLYHQEENEETVDEPNDAVALNYTAFDFSCTLLNTNLPDTTSYSLKSDADVHTISWKESTDKLTIDSIIIDDIEFLLQN